MTDDAMRFEELTRRYGEKTVLDRLSASVPRGSITALLGRNAAGKSTAIRCALGLIRADFGRVLIFGKDASSLPNEARARIGYVSETATLGRTASFEGLREFGKALYTTWDDALDRDLCERLELPREGSLSSLSVGQQRKAALWFNLAFRPELLVLDEPAGHLDVVVRREFVETILDLFRREGLTVLLSTHLMQDVERIADRVILLDHGHARFERSLDELKDSVKALRLDARGVNALPASLRVVDQRRLGSDALVTVEEFHPGLPGVVEHATGCAVEVLDLPLEEIFLAYCGSREAA